MREFISKTFTDAPTFWVMITAVGTFVLAGVTLALVIVAKKQLTALAQTSDREERTNRARFIYRIRRDFFTPEARQLMFLIEENLLKFHPEGIWYFSIEKGDVPEIEDRLADLNISYLRVSTNLLDDTLLGPLEDVAIFWQGGFLSLDDAYEEFDFYIHKCTSNIEINRYIAEAQKDPEDSDIYVNLQRLAAELKTHGGEKESRA